MTTNTNQAMFKVLLKQCVIVNDDLIFEAERELVLPIPPFVGLQLYNTE